MKLTNEAFDALLKRRRDLEKDLDVTRETYREGYTSLDTAQYWEGRIQAELEDVEAQIQAAIAEEGDV